MSLKSTLLSQRWLIGFSTATFVFAGFTMGRGEPLLGVGLGVLATAFLAIGDAQGRKELNQAKREGYAQGYAHAIRHTSMR